MTTTSETMAAALQYFQAGDLQGAEKAYRKVLQQQPEFAEAHSGLASVLMRQDKLGEAVACCLRALELNPNLAGACNLLGYALADQGHFELAVTYLRQAIQLAPDEPGASINLGGVLLSLGELEDGLACFRQALNLKPDHAAAHSNLLSGLQYRAGVTLSELADEHGKFERHFAAPLRTNWKPHDNTRDLHRPLRVGFLSPDFRNHPVSDFLIRPFENFDRNRIHAVGYYDHRVQDERTVRFKSAAKVWREVVGLSDELLSEQLRVDKIDILFDLAGHTANNRLLVFARKPAPIQITWMGYEGTTGLSAMDYILADRHEIPVEAERHYCERVLRMPDSYVCYEPPSNSPPVSSLPALERGYVTFGCFNNPKKINPQVIDVWARILRQLPTARLALKYNGIDDPASVRRLQSGFTAAGIDLTRVDFRGHSPFGEHLTDYRAIDVTLDPFPFGGGVTTCEALWMGVPVITCPGKTFASRHALGYLSSVGMTETIARDLDDYVHLTVTLAQDLPRLATLRSKLRKQMAAAPLCDGRSFADNLLTILTQVWREWCASR
jgi:protein O-GlcNAc transferase